MDCHEPSLTVYLSPRTHRTRTIDSLDLAGYQGYLFLEVFFTFTLSLALAFTFILYFWDQRHGDVLNASGAYRRAKAGVAIGDKSTMEHEQGEEEEPNTAVAFL